MKILVSDDGSIDDTMQILQAYQHQLGKNRFKIYYGPCKGYAANFLSLVCNPDAISDYFAYSDQDDIWEPHKLQRAIDWLSTIPNEIPALYCSRTKLINKKGKIIGKSILFKKNVSFSNALVQNIGGGNTMVFNNAALKLLRAAGNNFNIASHDWWSYLLVIGNGGSVYYDPYATIAYRQHSVNLFGSNIGLLASLIRVILLLQGRFKQWNDLNVKALFGVQHLLTDENQKLLCEFMTARNAKLLGRILQISRIGIYRQTRLGNIGLIFATILNKI